jgi:hypothetical protein
MRQGLIFMDYGLPDRLWAYISGTNECVAVVKVSTQKAGKYIAFYITSFASQGVFYLDDFDSLPDASRWIIYLDGEFR